MFTAKSRYQIFFLSKHATSIEQLFHLSHSRAHRDAAVFFDIVFVFVFFLQIFHFIHCVTRIYNNYNNVNDLKLYGNEHITLNNDWMGIFIISRRFCFFFIFLCLLTIFQSQKNISVWILMKICYYRFLVCLRKVYTDVRCGDWLHRGKTDFRSVVNRVA